MIIAIDGPAAAGKSTVAREVARALGLACLDTGAMYRAVTLAVLARGVDPADARGAAQVARTLELAVDGGGRMLVDGKVAEPAIRSPEVTGAVSTVAAHPGVRAAIVPLQRSLAEKAGGMVAEGRDIGTVVFPDADHKFFLRASTAVRARRRALEDGRLAELDRIRSEIRRRDELDATRAESPLRPAEDAVIVDTDGLDVAGVVGVVLDHVRGERRGGEQR